VAEKTDLLVLQAPDGRFAVVSRERMMAHVAPVSSVEDAPASMFRFLSALTWLSEADTCAQLAALGLTASEIDEQFAAVRRKQAVMTSAPTVMERITRIGCRNADGQEVIRKTARTGAGSQRVFVIRCGVCGHEYGAYGCDIDIRRCPSCQDGPPGLPTDGS
jgi:hypothetical protein